MFNSEKALKKGTFNFKEHFILINRCDVGTGAEKIKVGLRLTSQLRASYYEDVTVSR